MIQMRLPLAAAAAIAALTTAGCGGSSTSKPLSRAELTAKANAICRRIIPAVDWGKVAPQKLPALVGRLAALEERAASELEQLTPPASMIGEWRLIVDGFRLTGPEFRQIAAAIRRTPTAYVYLPLSNAQHERGLAAKVAGIKSCEQY